MGEPIIGTLVRGFELKALVEPKIEGSLVPRSGKSESKASVEPKIERSLVRCSPALGGVWDEGTYHWE